MPRHTRHILPALVLALTLAATSTATAEEQEDIVLSPGAEMTATSLGALTFTGRGSIEINLRCGMTLGGSVNAFVNAPGVPVGLVEEGEAECEGATAELLFPEEEKWLLLLASETEFLSSPTLVPLTLELAEVELDVGGVSCLYQGDISLSLPASGEPLETELLSITESAIRRIGGSIFCPTTGTIAGTLAFTQQAAQQNVLALRHNQTVAGYEFGGAGGTREITFVNISGDDKRVGRADELVGGNPITITGHTCRGPEPMQPRTLTDGNVRAETSFCRVTVRYDRPGGPTRNHAITDHILVQGDPGGNTLLGRVVIKGR